MKNSIDVAFLGPKGTYTHQAAKRYFGDCNEVPCSSIRDVIESSCDAGVIPFENSLEGGVGRSIDLLREKDVRVTGEQKIQIDHVLASKEEDLSNVSKVRSHPKAIGQCKTFLESRNFEEVEASSTAKAAEDVEEGEAAICSRLAAEMYDLNILEEDIQDKESNQTRFLILDNGLNKAGKTALILEPDTDRPGLLGSILSCFSSQDINLTYIQSRPTEEELGKYYFYVEAEAEEEDEDFQKALEAIKNYTNVKLLGSY